MRKKDQKAIEDIFRKVVVQEIRRNELRKKIYKHCNKIIKKHKDALGTDPKCTTQEQRQRIRMEIRVYLAKITERTGIEFDVRWSSYSARDAIYNNEKFYGLSRTAKIVIFVVENGEAYPLDEW